MQPLYCFAQAIVFYICVFRGGLIDARRRVRLARWGSAVGLQGRALLQGKRGGVGAATSLPGQKGPGDGERRLPGPQRCRLRGGPCSGASGGGVGLIGGSYELANARESGDGIGGEVGGGKVCLGAGS